MFDSLIVAQKLTRWTPWYYDPNFWRYFVASIILEPTTKYYEIMTISFGDIAILAFFSKIWKQFIRKILVFDSRAKFKSMALHFFDVFRFLGSSSNWLQSFIKLWPSVLEFWRYWALYKNIRNFQWKISLRLDIYRYGWKLDSHFYDAI